MREMKFRAWDIICERWRYSDMNGLSEFFKGVDDGKLINVCQFTGLKDKNGKEIYEEDIIKGFGKGKNCVTYVNLEVVYYDEEGCWCIKYDEDNYNYLYLMKHYEVIGNKFKNPELLK